MSALSSLAVCLDPTNEYEIGIDEAGRGPMLGRVYSAAVILPKEPSDFNYAWMKDSKKFHSPKKIKQVAEYIKTNAVAWHVSYGSEALIDEINIRNATHRAMHEAAKAVMQLKPSADYHLLVDGNDFKPLTLMINREFVSVPFTCIEGGDNKFCAIAAASILAKVARDTYIEELCNEHPELITKYDLLKNKGYGTAKHMEGIRLHGISPFHRRSFGICKMA